jgi:hypothetical protein
MWPSWGGIGAVGLNEFHPWLEDRRECDAGEVGRGGTRDTCRVVRWRGWERSPAGFGGGEARDEDQAAEFQVSAGGSQVFDAGGGGVAWWAAVTGRPNV